MKLVVTYQPPEGYGTDSSIYMQQTLASFSKEEMSNAVEALSSFKESHSGSDRVVVLEKESGAKVAIDLGRVVSISASSESEGSRTRR
jgi:hypothetical protein